MFYTLWNTPFGIDAAQRERRHQRCELSSNSGGTIDKFLSRPGHLMDCAGPPLVVALRG
jgi:hypothetical protein